MAQIVETPCKVHEDTQTRIADRLDRLILVMALVLYWVVSTGLCDAVHYAAPYEKKLSRSTQESRPKPHILVHPRHPPLVKIAQARPPLWITLLT